MNIVHILYICRCREVIQGSLVLLEISGGYDIDPKTSRPNKTTLSAFKRYNDTGKEFYFTNTHADFGESGSLATHQDPLIQI